MYVGLRGKYCEKERSVLSEFGKEACGAGDKAFATQRRGRANL